LDATRSSPCRRLGYIVTKGPAMTAPNQWITKNHCRKQPGPAVPSTARATGPRAHRPNRAAARQALGSHGQPRTSCLDQITNSAPALRLLARHRALTRPTSSTKPAPTRPAFILAKSGQSLYPLFVTSRFNSSTTQRRFHHDTHSSSLVSAGPATFSGSLQFFKDRGFLALDRAPARTRSRSLLLFFNFTEFSQIGLHVLSPQDLRASASPGICSTRSIT
jgi:hypothetical protein